MSSWAKISGVQLIPDKIRMVKILELHRALILINFLI